MGPARDAYINRIATSVPDHDIHDKFVNYAPSMIADERKRGIFKRMVERAQIEHRYSFLPPHKDSDKLDEHRFYRSGNFPDTAQRMRFYEDHALRLATSALDGLGLDEMRGEITHLIVTSCTGFYAPGLDLQIVTQYGLKASVERTVVGFMGCYAAMNALKLARHIVRSEADAKVLVVNLELCTLHLKESGDIEQLLSFLLFGDGCAASIVSARREGIEMRDFACTLLPDSGGQITWHIGQLGFDMLLSGQVPLTIAAQLQTRRRDVLANVEEIRHWAVHPGGRSVLDAVETGLELSPGRLAVSRDVLRRFGNTSSASIMMVLKEMLRGGEEGLGCAMAFGPGLTMESMRFAMDRP